MCGIAGILRWKTSRAQPGEIQRMTRALAHRGPDGEGFFEKDGLALGHRRLAIIDPSAGQQPMSNEDGQVWVTFNGEIYNFQELRSQLQDAGHAFRTRCDTEVIVHAYEQWGDDCVLHFRGMFACAIADLRQRRLLLARDHFGIKPLCYRVGRDYIAFASELNALRQVDDDQPAGNLQAVELFLRYQYIPAPHTIFQDIHKLPPASRVAIDFSGRMSPVDRYWELKFRPDHSLTPVEWLQEADDVIRESVQAHLVSDVPFGVLLSGGIDSTLIAWHMSRLLDKPVKAFCIGFDDKDATETHWADEAARRCGIELHSDVVASDAMEIMPEIVRLYGEPFGDSSALPTWHVSRLARSHVPMVLSGDGGDEAFAGYASYEHWMQYRTFDRARHWFGKWPRKCLEETAIALQHRMLGGFAWGSVNRWRNLLLYARDPIRRDLWQPRHAALADQMMDPFAQAARHAPRGDMLAFAQYMDYQTYLPNDILPKVDMASMAHGLEVRPPLVDLRVVQFAASLPMSMRASHAPGSQYTGKRILKDLLRRHFPDSFVHRKKQGFSLPRTHWFLPGRHGRVMLESLLRDPDTRLFDLFNPKTLQSQLQRHSIQQDNSGVLWLMLVLGHWLKQNPNIRFPGETAAASPLFAPALAKAA